MGPHLVHLEDERSLREALDLALHDLISDLTLAQFANSDDALAYAEAHRDTIDLFVLDIRVPGQLNGLEFATALRQNGSKAVIIFTSAYNAPEGNTLQTLGAHYVRKPWGVVEFAEHVLSLLP